jgi:hypothetical protein
MMKRDAAGRHNGMIESFVEKELFVFSEYVKHALQNATALSGDANDPYGHRRSSEVGDAVRLAKSSAELCVALAKLRGETTHRAIVLKSEPVREEPPPADAAPYPPAYDGEAPLFTEEEWRSDSLTNAQLWERDQARRDERARRAGWIAGEPPPPSLSQDRINAAND